MNKGVSIALISIGLAQAVKIPLHFMKSGEWKPEMFLAQVECQVLILQV